MPSTPDDRRRPLAPLQEEILRLSTGAPGRGLHIHQLTGEVDPSVEPGLMEAWARAFRRYPELRARVVHDASGIPWIETEPESGFPWHEHHWTSLSLTDAGEGLEELLAGVRTEGFDPGRGPLHRLDLIRLEGAAFLAWTYHQLAVDDPRAVRILAAVLEEAGIVARGETPGPVEEEPPPIPAEEPEGAEEWWRTHLRLPLPGPHLPPLPPGTALEPPRASQRRSLGLSRELTRRLEGMAREGDLPLEALLRAAWSVVVARLSGSEEVVLGLLAPDPGGGFRTPLPLPASVRGDVSGPVWARVLHEQVLRGAAMAPVSPGRLRRWIDVDVQTPLSTSLLSWWDRSPLVGLPAVGGRGFTLSTRWGWPLVLEAWGGEALEMHLSFDPTRTDAAWAEATLERLALLLEAMAANPSAPLASLPSLTPREEAVLRAWNASGTRYDELDFAHRVVAARAATTPESIAVEDSRGWLDYGSLCAGANRLSHALVEAGVRPGDPVALAVPPGRDLLLGVLGILGAGAAWVPMDPSHPKDRLAKVVRELGVVRVVMRAALRGSVPSGAAGVVLLDDVESRDDLPADDPGIPLTPRHPACVVPVPGRSGDPLGVVIGHGNLAHHLQAVRLAMGITPGDRYLDPVPALASAWAHRLLVPLVAGGGVVTVERDELDDPRGILQRVRESRVTVLALSASRWARWTTWLEALPESERRALLDNRVRLLVSHSEPLPADLPLRWRVGLGHPAGVVNVYGVTEVTGMATLHAVEDVEAEARRGRLIPIGRPIPNTIVRVAGIHGQPAPPGVVGEIRVGGAGVATGYHGNEALTQERFEVLPGSRDGRRFYRTGDRGRWREDGVLEWVDRQDLQVKIDGVRVELEEVETALRQHPEVEEALVAAWPEEEGGLRLVGYVVGAGGRSPSPDELREHLSRILPAPMLPSSIVFLDALPRTAEGELDRPGLPSPQEETAGAGFGPLDPPRTAVEARVAGILRDVLGLETLGIHDDLFDRGGDSLAALRIADRLTAAFDRRISVRAVLEDRSAAALARRLEELQAQGDGGEAEGESDPEERLAAWRRTLGLPLPPLELPMDPPEGGHPSRDSLPFRLPQPLREGLEALCRQEGCTPFMGLMAGLHLLLRGYGGPETATVGAVARREGGAGPAPVVVPVRVPLAGDLDVRGLLRRTRDGVLEALDHREFPLEQVLGVVYEDGRRHQEGEAGPRLQVVLDFRPFSPVDAPTEPGPEGSDLTLVVHPGAEGWEGRAVFDPGRFRRRTVERMIGHLQELLSGMVEAPASPVEGIPLLPPAEAEEMAAQRTASFRELPPPETVHGRFEARSDADPLAEAVTDGGRTLSYLELESRANRLAHHLRSLGVGPDRLVALCLDSSLELPVAILGVLKAGGACVPIAPSAPDGEVRRIASDTGAAVLITTGGVLEEDAGSLQVVRLDAHRLEIAGLPETRPSGGAGAHHLAFLLEGRGGDPRVLVEHRNVVNLLVGLEERLGGDTAGAWLSSGPISSGSSAGWLVSLLAPLCRGGRLVLHREGASRRPPAAHSHRKLELSVFLGGGSKDDPGYRVLKEAARVADDAGLVAVWISERHFEPSGGAYPSPPVAAAALAALTESVGIRGAVLLPLHDPLRIAEDWAMVDALSGGRSGIAVTAGGHEREYVLNAAAHPDRHTLAARHLEAIRTLWRGEGIPRRGPRGEVEVTTWPRPIQGEPPLWLSAGGSDDPFVRAGSGGLRILTHLLGQEPRELARRIGLYRRAWEAAGHPGRGHVTVVLHTCIGSDARGVREAAFLPFQEHLRREHPGLVTEAGEGSPGGEEDEGEASGVLVDRLWRTAGLMGTVDECLELLDGLKALGVDECACLVDFGVSLETALATVELLGELVRREGALQAPREDAGRPSPVPEEVGRPGSDAPLLPAILAAAGVTHLTCAAADLSRWGAEGSAPEALESLRWILVEGEATMTPELGSALSADLVQLWGMPETGLWCAARNLRDLEGEGASWQPLANTRFHVVDPWGRPVPFGVPGELVVGGEGVARGYANDPELTARRFPPDPEPGREGARVFRTGERVRLQDTGRVVGLAAGGPREESATRAPLTPEGLRSPG